MFLYGTLGNPRDFRVIIWVLKRGHVRGVINSDLGTEFSAGAWAA